MGDGDVDAVERLKRTIDAIFVADARTHPGFALARSTAVRALLETMPHDFGRVHAAVLGLRTCRVYEERRGQGREPSVRARKYAEPHAPIVEAYERARSLA